MTRRGDRQARLTILASAERQFARAGFAGVSVQDIIAGTGFTRPTLYYHFRSKAGLFQALLDHAHDACHQRMQSAAARAQGVEAKLRAVLAALFAFLGDRRDLTRLAFAAAFAAPEELPPELRGGERRDRNFDFFHALVRDGQREGALGRRFDSRELTYGIFGALSFHLMANILWPGTPLNRRTARRVVALFMEGARAR
jgi:AcrR family transcriptional regulator